MTVFNFKKKLPCGDNCFQDVVKQVSDLCPNFEDSVTGHITMVHSRPFHQVWITFYDHGKHENWRTGEIISTKFIKSQRKFKGILPSLSQLQNL